MGRLTGTYLTSSTLGEQVRAFVPFALPPTEPSLSPTSYDTLNRQAELALARLSGLAGLVPSVDWLPYGSVRKEALLTSQIEGTQATLFDLLDDEAGFTVSNPDDVQEVTNYLRAFRLVQPKTWERDGRLVEVASGLREVLGEGLFEDHNLFRDQVDATLKKTGAKLAAADLKLILKAVSWRAESAPPVIAKVHKPGKVKADPFFGHYEAAVDGRPAIVDYEPDADLRDTEQVPLLEEGGIEEFVRRDVLPYTPDTWVKEDATKIGYEVSFTRHFYKPQPLRTLEEISADILAIEKEAEGLLDGLLKVGGQRA